MKSWWRVLAGAITMMAVCLVFLASVAYIDSLPINLCGTDINGVISQGNCK